MEGFAVVGCEKCRRLMAADLSYDTKTCQCGHKIQLRKAKLLAVFSDAATAAIAVQKLQEEKNTGFAPASSYSALADTLESLNKKKEVM